MQKELKNDKHVWAWERVHLKDIYEKVVEPNFEMFSDNILRFTEDRKHGIFENRCDYSKILENWVNSKIGDNAHLDPWPQPSRLQQVSGGSELVSLGPNLCCIFISDVYKVWRAITPPCFHGGRRNFAHRKTMERSRHRVNFIDLPVVETELWPFKLGNF